MPDGVLDPGPGGREGAGVTGAVATGFRSSAIGSYAIAVGDYSSAVGDNSMRFAFASSRRVSPSQVN